jgi:hypothetical protein
MRERLRSREKLFPYRSRSREISLFKTMERLKDDGGWASTPSRHTRHIHRAQ